MPKTPRSSCTSTATPSRTTRPGLEPATNVAPWGRGSATTWRAASSPTSSRLDCSRASAPGTPSPRRRPAVVAPAGQQQKYPRDVHGEVHDDGEIWSACLWEPNRAGRPRGRHAGHRPPLPADAELHLRGRRQRADHHRSAAQQRAQRRRHPGCVRARGILPNPKRKNRRAGFRFDDIRRAAPRRTVARSRRR